MPNWSSKTNLFHQRSFLLQLCVLIYGQTNPIQQCEERELTTISLSTFPLECINSIWRHVSNACQTNWQPATKNKTELKINCRPKSPFGFYVYLLGFIFSNCPLSSKCQCRVQIRGFFHSYVKFVRLNCVRSEFPGSNSSRIYTSFLFSKQKKKKQKENVRIVNALTSAWFLLL